MGFAPVPTEKCAAWLRRRVFDNRAESKEQKGGGPRPETGVPQTSFYLLV
jgi:hypothetical protein